MSRHPRVENQPKHLLQTVVRVDHGRGFIVNAINRRRFVVTAAHCLERTRLATLHRNLTFAYCLGMLDAKQLSISAELCFLSLVDDLAVLAAPKHGEQAKAFSGLTTESALRPAADQAAVLHQPRRIARLGDVDRERVDAVPGAQ